VDEKCGFLALMVPCFTALNEIIYFAKMSENGGFLPSRP
jgi:hypothetical protein